MSDTIMQSTWQTKELGMVTRKGKSLLRLSLRSFFPNATHYSRLEKMEVLLVLFGSRSGKEVTFVTPKGKRIRASQNEKFFNAFY